MSNRFTGLAIARGVSLPDDMWEYLRLRAKQEDRSLSAIVRRAVEHDMMDRAERHLAERHEYAKEGSE